jgi:ribosome-associated heat shock protein Hsp15
MRVDQVLRWLCLVKSRSQAARECRAGRILVNGQAVRPAHEVRAGDSIRRIDLAGGWRQVRLREVPARQMSRKEAPDFYETEGEARGPLLPEGAPGMEPAERDRL